MLNSLHQNTSEGTSLMGRNATMALAALLLSGCASSSAPSQWSVCLDEADKLREARLDLCYLMEAESDERRDPDPTCRCQRRVHELLKKDQKACERYLSRVGGGGSPG